MVQTSQNINKTKKPRSGNGAAPSIEGGKAEVGATEPKHSVVAAFGQGDEFGCVCTKKNDPGKAEFIAFDVPRAKVEDLARTMNFLAPRSIQHGESVESHGFYLVTKELTGESKQKALSLHACGTDPNQPLLELVPRFPFKDRKDWGARPPSPVQGTEGLVDAILRIWKEQCNKPGFILFIDGNPGNCALNNLKFVDLAVALRHSEDWKVDWDTHLTQEQATFVHQNNWHFYLLAKILFRPKEVCETCGLMDPNKLQKCAACKSVWYCCAKHQKEDWKEHKKVCAREAGHRNKEPMPGL